jgi:hypothetical protein
MKSEVGRIEMNLDLWPLTRAYFHSESVTMADLAWLYARVDEIFARREGCVFFTDARRITAVPGPDERRFIAEKNRSTEELSRLYSAGTAVVMTSSLVRGTLTAISWLRRPVVPHAWVATERAALQWCLARLDARSIAVPDEVRQAIVQEPTND